jgi:uncharacterized C2H2 Zn-finger protein
MMHTEQHRAHLARLRDRFPMAIYNELRAVIRCPRCGCIVERIVNLYFGYRDLLPFHIGDKYRWTSSPLVKNGGRPEGGNLDGEGYTECPCCGKDFFVVVEIRDDTMIAAYPDLAKRPLLPD